MHAKIMVFERLKKG